jgi:hypothetical protein
MNTNHARGWRRIGIVASVIWFIAFGAYLWRDGNQRHADSYTSSREMCSLELDTLNKSLGPRLGNPNLKEYDRKFAENLANFEKCNAYTDKVFLSQADEFFKNIPILLGVDLATIAIGWALVWFVVVVVRWVRRGFTPA